MQSDHVSYRWHRWAVGRRTTDASVERRSCVGRPSTDVGRASVKCRSRVARRTTDTWPTLGLKCRPTVDRLSVEHYWINDTRPAVDRLSTDSRPPVSQHETNCKGPVSLALFCAIFDANSYTTLVSDGTKRSSEHLLSFSEEINNLRYSGMSKTRKFLMGHR